MLGEVKLFFQPDWAVAWVLALACLLLGNRRHGEGNAVAWVWWSWTVRS